MPYSQLTKSVHAHYHYGIRPQKTILIMVLGGPSSIIVVYINPHLTAAQAPLQLLVIRHRSCHHAAGGQEEHTVGALIIRIGFWGPLHYTDNKEPPK